MKALFWVYFAAVNLIAMILCVYDKHQARRHRWRVPEKTLFFIALLGGSPAMYLSMLFVRHKTGHLRFMVGLPLILVAQIVLLLLYFLRCKEM
ncbi:MAG: DUF1294 domain-containing protein [Clostridia bacterium]|nr:DUF1294 domain-containing protein [Clostridia bacterium]